MRKSIVYPRKGINLWGVAEGAVFLLIGFVSWFLSEGGSELIIMGISSAIYGTVLIVFTIISFRNRVIK
jgi:hypothetical protein